MSLHGHLLVLLTLVIAAEPTVADPKERREQAGGAPAATAFGSPLCADYLVATATTAGGHSSLEASRTHVSEQGNTTRGLGWANFAWLAAPGLLPTAIAFGVDFGTGAAYTLEPLPTVVLEPSEE